MTGPAIDPVGFARLSDVADGDAAFIAELIDTYLDDGERQLAELEAAVAAGDPAAVLRPAHSLKTGSANVGASQVASLAAELEAGARTATIANGPAVVASLRDWFERSRTELLELRNGG